MVACLVAGAIVGSSYYRQTYVAGGKPWFYQVDFGPAVMWTCGYGFVVPDDAAIPALGRFLRQEVDQFSCVDMPAEPPLRPVAGAQPWLMWSHLLRSASILWSVSGISWSGLAPLAGLFFAITVALAYVLMRLVSGKLLSIFGAFFVLTSPLFLTELPQFRDFSKVPFMFGLAWLMAQLLDAPIARRRLLAIAAGYGALVGLAIGFRNDVLITMPPFVLLLVLARPLRPIEEWRSRGLALLLAGIAFVVLASPVIRVYANGGGASMSHAALLGMMRPIDSSLSISNGGLYEIGYGLEDSYAAALVSGYASRRAGAPVAIDGHSREYDAAAGSLLRALLLALPGDALTRGYAAFDRVLALPSSVVETQSPPFVGSRMTNRFYALRSRLALSLWWIWLPAVALAVLLVSLRDLKLALLLGLLLGYFCAYPAIQFNARHVLHLSLIPVAALAYVLQTAVDRRWGSEWRSPLIVAVISTAIVVLPLLLLRWVQDRHVRSLIHGYLSAPAEPVEFSERLLANDRIALDFDFRQHESLSGSVATDYLIAEFDAATCDVSAVDLTLQYETSHGFADFTRHVTVSLLQEGGSTRVTMATYSYSVPASASGDALSYKPKAIELPVAQRSCLSKVTRLREPDHFPILLNTTLPSDWERLPLHLTLSRWERRPTSATPAVYLSPPSLQFAKASGTTGEPLRLSDLVEAARSVAMPVDGRLLVDGVGGIGGVGPYAYLAQFRERSLARGRRLVVEGDLKQGGLSAGWLTNGGWTGQLAIAEPGPFVAVFEIPADGNYSFVIANNLPGSSLRNVCDFTRLAWLP